MTDQPAPAPAAAAAPIQVRPHAAPIVTEESCKLLVVAGCAIAAERLVQSPLALAAVVPAGAAVAAVVWGVLQRLRTWRALKFLAAIVPDDVAAVGGPQ